MHITLNNGSIMLDNDEIIRHFNLLIASGGKQLRFQCFYVPTEKSVDFVIHQYSVKSGIRGIEFAILGKDVASGTNYCFQGHIDPLKRCRIKESVSGKSICFEIGNDSISAAIELVKKLISLPTSKTW